MNLLFKSLIRWYLQISDSSLRILACVSCEFTREAVTEISTNSVSRNKMSFKKFHPFKDFRSVQIQRSSRNIHFFFFIRILFSRARLNILIFPPILGCKYSCIILNDISVLEYIKVSIIVLLNIVS